MDENVKILIVEDEALVAASIKRHLGNLGYTVVGTAASAAKAFELLEADCPHLVLLDIKIKGDLDGIQTAEKIRDKYGIPYIYLTAHTDGGTLERAKKTEPYGYVVKPIEPRNMHSAIEMALYKHRAEGDLKESEERYRTLIEGADQPIFTVDNRGNILFTNRIAHEHFGEPTEGKVYDWIPKALTHPLKNLIGKTFETQTVQMMETTVLVDGEKAWYDIRICPLKNKDDQVDSVMVIACDISDRKTVEEERIRLVEALEHADETIIITDREANIIYANSALEKNTGYTPDEVMGRRPNIFKSGKHDTVFYKQLFDVLESGDTWRGMFINKKKDGTLYEEEATISPVKDEEGHISNYVAVKRDVTEERKLEKQLQQAKKLEAIGTLAGGIAHDFNNIIHVINANAQLAMQEVVEGTEVRECLEDIYKASKRASDLVSKILTFSRDKEEKREPVVVRDMVKEVVKMINTALPENLVLKDDIKEDDIYVWGDPTEIHQVIMNLCKNAIHATIDNGGEISVRLDDVALDSEFLSAYPKMTPGRYTHVEIKDTGCGMDEETLEHIYEPFFTTKKPGEGTGMGLSVVHGIVKSHKGILTVDSEVDVGTAFSVFLPIFEANA